jgi:hypothetical protein
MGIRVIEVDAKLHMMATVANLTIKDGCDGQFLLSNFEA